MAYADFTFWNNNPTYIQGGEDCLGVAHTLSGAGERLRRVVGSRSWPDSVVLVSGSIVRTNLLNPGNSTTAVSQRAWVRYKIAALAQSWYGGKTALCLGARCYYNGGSLQLDPINNGYKVLFGTHNGLGDDSSLCFGLYLRCAGGGYGNSSLLTCASFTPVESTWYPIRLDCIPLSTTRDVLRVYSGTGTPGAEVWTLQIEYFPEQSLTNGFSIETAFGLGWRQVAEDDPAALMDVHHYRVLVKAGGPFPEEE